MVKPDHHRARSRCPPFDAEPVFHGLQAMVQDEAESQMRKNCFMRSVFGSFH